MKKLQTTNDKRQTNRGFTLVEILIASYIFLLVVVAGTAIFSSSVGAKMKASAFWTTQQEARYAMEKIIKTIRSENVRGLGIYDSNSRLVLCGTVGQCPEDSPLQFWLESSTEGSAIYFQDEEENLSTLTSPDSVKVTNLEFKGYYPVAATPGIPGTGSDRQPYITIEMTVENAPGERVVEKDTLTLKTTVSLRTYGYKYGY